MYWIRFSDARLEDRRCWKEDSAVNVTKDMILHILLIYLQHMHFLCILCVTGYREHVYRDGDQTVLVYVPEGHGLLHTSRWENSKLHVRLCTKDERERKG